MGRGMPNDKSNASDYLAEVTKLLAEGKSAHEVSVSLITAIFKMERRAEAAETRSYVDAAIKQARDDFAKEIAAINEKLGEKMNRATAWQFISALLLLLLGAVLNHFFGIIG